jgi:hypothetical protein
MSAYLTVTFEYASREDAETCGFPGDDTRGYVCEPVSDTPPVVLHGLVKGGEFSTKADWPGPKALYVDANGKVFRFVSDALRHGTLPVTWYTVAP